jgi:sulfite exporter TauE/SafE
MQNIWPEVFFLLPLFGFGKCIAMCQFLGGIEIAASLFA